MTEEERQRLTDAKERVTAQLANEKIARFKLPEIDVRLHEYVTEVAEHPEAHNVFEQLAVARFLTMCGKYGLDIIRLKRFIVFYEALWLPGVKGAQRYKLTPVQVFQFASIYGFWKGKKRIVREAVLFVPRKFSKTTSAAAFAVWDVIFGDANAEAYIGANSQDQAKKCFDVIRGCFRKLDPTGKYYTVNEQIIKSRRADRSAFAQCLTANARTKDGLNASTVIMDEFSQARDGELLTVLTTSMGARLNPLTVIITTASDVFSGPFYEQLEGYKKLLLGDFEDDSAFAHLFMPDMGDDEADPRTWHKVHPHMGVTVSEEFYFHEYEKAKRAGAGALLAFRTKLLNIYTENQQAAWLGGRLAQSIMEHRPLYGFNGKPPAEVAFDLSVSDDFSAVSLGTYDRATKRYFFHTDYFFPRGALDGHRNEHIYRAWADAGHLILLDGDVIDYQASVKHIIGYGQYFRIHGIGYDRYKSHEVVNALGSMGFKNALREVSQRHGEFMAPVQFFEHAVKTGGAYMNDNPINAYCFANAVVVADGNGNLKPYKRQAHLKIDGLITMLMTARMILNANAPS